MISTIGIDPGESGVCCLLFEDHAYEFFSWQGLKKACDQLMFWKAEYKPALVSLEKIPFIPGGQYASHKLNRNYGQWMGLLMGLGMRFDLVDPKEWESILLPPRPGWTTTKHRSVFTCQELIPNCQKHIRLKKHHNRSDAFLLAYRGLRKVKVMG